MAKLPILKEVMCGFTLRTGARIAAYYMFFSNLLLLLPVLAAPFIHFEIETYLEGGKGESSSFAVFAWIIGVLVIISFIINTLLFVGVLKEIPWCMIPWMVEAIICMGLLAVVFVIGLVALWLRFANFFVSYYLSLHLIASASIQFGIIFYIYHIIYSYYRHLRESNAGGFGKVRLNQI